MKTNDPIMAILLFGDSPHQECADGAQSLCILSPALALNPREASGKRAWTAHCHKAWPVAFQVKGPVFESDLVDISTGNRADHMELVDGVEPPEKASRQQHKLHDASVVLDISFGLWKDEQDMLSSGPDATTAALVSQDETSFFLPSCRVVGNYRLSGPLPYQLWNCHSLQIFSFPRYWQRARTLCLHSQTQSPDVGSIW